MNATVKRNLILGYGLSLLLIIITGAVSFYSINNLLDSSKMVNHTNTVIKKLDDVISFLKDAETGQRGYLLTGEAEFLEPYNGTFIKIYSLIDEVKGVTADNVAQQETLEKLRNVIASRISQLQLLIDARRAGRNPTVSELNKGKKAMDEARTLVQTMEDREQSLLTIRTDRQNRFAGSMPLLIGLSSLLALVITILSFARVNKDFDKRARLQRSLEKKDIEITKRIESIQKIAGRISQGDYAVRITDEEKDSLGNLSGSLNKMAASLQHSFQQLSDKEWLQTGIAKLNDVLIGDKNIEVLTSDVLPFVTEYTGSSASAFYIAKENGQLYLSSSYALKNTQKKAVLASGQGLAGQAAISKKIIGLSNLQAGEYVISFATGDVKPKHVLAIPILHNNLVKGVMELSSMENFSEKEKALFEIVSLNTGIAITSAENRKRVYELLDETQAQSEELQAQHEELENTNAELQAQSEKLQVSEEELKVQQEELQQANQELEERSRLLEERNEMIVERNLEIQAKAEALEISTKYKSEFLANMSHELRTPLNSVLLLSRLLSENQGKNLSADQVEYARVIQSSGTGLLRLIDEILDLSKIESGKMNLEYADVLLEDLQWELKAMFSPAAKEKGISFIIEPTSDLPLSIKTDRLRLDQILRNLIANALKFTAQGSVTLFIKKEKENLLFIVKDTGIGIAKENQQSIFEAFQQADGSTRRKYGGTGLGLSISRELAKLLGGSIAVKSEEGRGSEFILSIPTSKKEQQAAPGLHTLPQVFMPSASIMNEPVEKNYLADIIPASVPDDRDSIVQGDKILLIVEDDIAFAKSLLDYARQKSYKGLIAVRGDEGVELANRFLPNAILLDLQLPVKNGWAVMDLLKQNSATRHIPVHIMSSHSERMKSLSKGAVDFINKPMAFEKMGEVFQKIEQALSRFPKKVLIVEENQKHAKALAYYLENFDVVSEIKTTVAEGVEALHREEIDCVILDIGIPALQGYSVLEEVKKTPGFENLPIIIFTGKNLSHVEEMRIKKYADSIVIKTAHSYQRILDEVSLFLHRVEENKTTEKKGRYKKMGALTEVLKDRTVLIADDDVRNIFSLTKSLESFGMQVLSAMDGKDALKQLEENKKVDVVLMDMMMPEMDGYESTKRIREKRIYKDLPIIAVTAKAMTGDREKCIIAGASDYITKPVDIDQLTSLLRVWLYDKE